MRRVMVLVGGWALATLAATGVGLVALGRVTDQVAPSQALPPPAAPVALETAQPEGPPTAAPRRTDEPAAADPQTETEGYELTGGAVTVRYSDGDTMLVQATPSSGFEMDVKERGPAKVEVRFRSDAHESRFVARWEAGAPMVDRDERAR